MKSQRASVAILFACLVIVMLGFGIVMPLVPFYVSHFGASGSAVGVVVSIYSFMQFIFAPLWGRLSDRIGRKPVLLIGIAGYAIAFVFQAFAQNLAMFLAARALAGILSSATLPTAMAYAADTSHEDDRSGAIGQMGAAIGLGMVFGPMLGGVLTKLVLPFPPAFQALLQTMIDPSTGQLISLSMPYLGSALIATIAAILVMAFLPESLPASRRYVAPRQSGSRLAQLAGALRGPLGFLFVMAFLVSFALANMESVLGLYGKDAFNMGPADVGMLMGAIGLLTAFQQGVLIRPLTRRYGERRVLQIGLVIGMLGFIGLALWRAQWGMIISAVVFNGGNALLWPSVSALISKRSQGGQGAAMGLAQSFQSLGRATGPLWAGVAYDVSGMLPFITGAVMQLIAFVVSLRVAVTGMAQATALAPSPVVMDRVSEPGA
jgi:MFS transporter, DHA1 family, multidrug resistance protein